MKRFIGLFIGVFVVAAFYVMVAYFQCNILIQNPMEKRALPEESPSDYGLSFEDVILNTDDGVNITAWYIPSKNRAVIIDLHGYKGHRAWELDAAKVFADNGYGVLLIDMRTHGHSEGDMITFGYKEKYDIDTGIKFLENRSEVDPDKIGIIGNGSGGAIAIIYASQNPKINAVLSDCAYACLEEEIATALEVFRVPGIFAPTIRWFAEKKIGFNVNEVSPINHIGDISPRPVFLMQGGKDIIVPPDSGHKLFNAAKEPKELWYEPELEHAKFRSEKANEYEKRVIEFVDRYLLENTGI